MGTMPEPERTDDEPSLATCSRSRSRMGGRMVAPKASELREVMELGRGGMGVVSLVLDGDGLPFALKKLLPELAREPEKRELFLREARVARALVHPNVVRAFAAESKDEGEPFLVMELIDGLPLDKLLGLARSSHRPLPRPLAAHVVACLAAGLHAAHELTDENGTPLNLVHRDISPHNVMVSRDGDVVLLDFGVAKIDATRGLTKTGEVRGKTSYMSPEQGLGDPLDRRSDIFSLGAILYECVQGTRMWGDGTELDVLRKLALEPAPSIDGDDELTKLHAKLVARAPDGRPDTARDVAEALMAYATRPGETKAALAARARRELTAWVAEIATSELDERQRLLSEAIEPVRASLPSGVPALPELAIAPSPIEGTAARARSRKSQDGPEDAREVGDGQAHVVDNLSKPSVGPKRRGAVVAIVTFSAAVTLALAVVRARPTAPETAAKDRDTTAMAPSAIVSTSAGPLPPKVPEPTPSGSASSPLAPKDTARSAAKAQLVPPQANSAIGVASTRPLITTPPIPSAAPKPSTTTVPLNVDPSPF